MNVANMVSMINPRNNQEKRLNNPASDQPSRESRNRHNINVFPLLEFFAYPPKINILEIT